MNLALFIARRYFLSRKKKKFINVISIISMFVVAIGTMALVIVLSVFNGLEGLLRSLYGTVDPDLVITAAEGKTFDYTDALKTKVDAVPEVASLTELLEDNVLVRYNNAQRVARVKGVSQTFIREGRLKDYIVYGDFKLDEDGVAYAIIGRGVQYDLSVNPSNDFYTLQMYYPKNLRPGVMNPSSMYNVQNILPGSVFAVEKSYDENYIYVPLSFARNLFGKSGQLSALELQLTPGANPARVKQQVASLLGDDFTVRSGEELHGGLFKILRIEKFFLFLIFSIIIAIASINIFFSLTMLVIDKKKDVAILAAQGATPRLIRNIFLLEGCIVAFTGAFAGLALGLLISYIQQAFGVIGMGMQTAIMEAYPVQVKWEDVALTVLCIIVITIVTAIQPALSATRHIPVKMLQ